MHQTAIIRIRHVRQTLIQVSVGVWVCGVWVWGVGCRWVLSAGLGGFSRAGITRLGSGIGIGVLAVYKLSCA